VDGAPFIEDWEYASIVGMLMYLAANTRPDIAYAVHQAARYTHNPRASHAVAIKRILRYIKGTKDKGIYFTPDGTEKIDCYVDSDFAGLFSVEDKQQPISAVLHRIRYSVLWGTNSLRIQNANPNNIIHYGGRIYCLVTIYERFNPNQRDPERNQSHSFFR
jgi:hypothetical protein